ncbi:uncharacterized protein ASCRUDRAFT_93192 [Ascoidea rubescens DSM 1968]|uniref:Globin domain-containing protein n=1 Tax=Ascoidea rubescens DSM 1968 TaxID=1344418 RepID=A0A1D2V9T2_9ASCO|nr:hypothetical protein ASCRUDRAFT_93192 [Ascoidea rubescens DSM 1968]ODV58257.1 hypothetical protein ASCRUDRAFT_93192 [Ascoidea rubescens DSM 1968]
MSFGFRKMFKHSNSAKHERDPKKYNSDNQSDVISYYSFATKDNSTKDDYSLSSNSDIVSSNNSSIKSSPIKKTSILTKNNLTKTNTNTSNSNNDSLLKFTPDEMALLRKTWNENLIPPVQTVDGYLKITDKNSKINSFSHVFTSIQFWNEIHSNAFLINPDLDGLLPSVNHQALHFAGILRMAILNLEDLSGLSDYLGAIGRRHGIIFGTEPRFFQELGIAVFKSLYERFGDAFTPEIENLWIALYSFIANTMIEACSIDVKLNDDGSFSPTNTPKITINNTTNTNINNIKDTQANNCNPNTAANNYSYSYNYNYNYNNSAININSSNKPNPTRILHHTPNQNLNITHNNNSISTTIGKHHLRRNISEKDNEKYAIEHLKVDSIFTKKRESFLTKHERRKAEREAALNERLEKSSVNKLSFY